MGSPIAQGLAGSTVSVAADRPTRVLVVDDAPDARLMARAGLEDRGFDVVEAHDGESAVEAVSSDAFDLVVLDINLPGMSGLAVLRRVRQDSDVAVILLTGLADETDRILGLELGADDYMVKPFSPAELGVRALTVLRRVVSGTAPGRPDLPVLIRLGERRVLVHGVEVTLSALEFDLLACLASVPKRVFSRRDLLERVWNSAPDWQDPATVTEHIRRLRRKIEADPEQPVVLQTVRGVGYRFDPAGRVFVSD